MPHGQNIPTPLVGAAVLHPQLNVNEYLESTCHAGSTGGFRTPDNDSIRTNQIAAPQTTMLRRAYSSSRAPFGFVQLQKELPGTLL